VSGALGAGFLHELFGRLHAYEPFFVYWTTELDEFFCRSTRKKQLGRLLCACE
jgi:hypothetical protein